MRVRRVCILGGSGFIGRHLVNRLQAHGINARVSTRYREGCRHLLVVPGLELQQLDVEDAGALEQAIAGCDAAINLVGILNEKGDDGSGFRRAHVDLTRRIIEACGRVGVRRLLQMSALGANAKLGPSHYQRSKGEAENLALEANGKNLAVTVFRPSVVFGPGDSFFNRFATLLRLGPVFPVPTPSSRFAPVYVGDVTEAMVSSLEREETFGRSYDLCGPKTYSMRELVEYTARTAGMRRLIIGCSDRFSRLQARVLQRLPGKPYSMDNFRSSQIDNVCSRGNGLEELGIAPTAIEAVVPGYLSNTSQRMRYNRFRQTARR